MPIIYVLLLVVAMTACTKEEDTQHAVPGNAPFMLSSSVRVELQAKAEKNDAEAAYRLAQHYSMIENDFTSYAHWLGVAAANGHVKAQYSLGHYYLFNTESRDKKQAFHWLSIAAQNGDKKAREYVEMFHTGENVEEVTQLAEKGDADAAFKLYKYYNYIEGEHSTASYWLSVAADKGNSEAVKLIKQNLR